MVMILAPIISCISECQILRCYLILAVEYYHSAIIELVNITIMLSLLKLFKGLKINFNKCPFSGSAILYPQRFTSVLGFVDFA